MLSNESPIPTQCDKFNSDPTIYTAHYNSPDPCHGQADRPHSNIESDKISKTNRPEDVTWPKHYSAYLSNFDKMLT